MKTVIGLFNNLGDARVTLDEFAHLGLYADKVGLLTSEPGAGSGVGMKSLDLPEVGHAAANTAMLEWLRSPGGIAGALTRLGVSKGDAERCIATLKRGGTLEAVIVDESKEQDAQEIMRTRTMRYDTGATLPRTQSAGATPEPLTSGAKPEPLAGGALGGRTEGQQQVLGEETDAGSTAAQALQEEIDEARDVGHMYEVARAETDITIPIIEEELEVSTREVDAGGVRVHTHVTEVPAEKTVTLREERVRVERRTVDRPVDDREEVFQDRAFEMKASAEQPHITKRAHVVEEIRIHKDAEEHEERIFDQVRHTEVDITELPSYAESEPKLH